MNQSKSGPGVWSPALRQFGWVALFLVILLGFLFQDGILPGRTIFSNDGPLGAISSKCASLPQGFFGFWNELNWLGATGPSAAPDVSNLLSLATGKLIFSKIYAPFALFFLGLSAWLCFRQWKFTPAACILGGIAAALNSDFFSTACWGVAGQPISFGLDFLALAALGDATAPRRWLRIILAGLAVGMSVMEAFDIGAIFSLVVAAYVMFQALVEEGTPRQNLSRGAARLALVAAFAGVIAFQTVTSLIGTQIKGVAGMGQDATSKAQRWDEATMWSMPKAETLSMVVPGLFGFRMDTPGGGNYWGRCGRHPAWDRYFASGKEGQPPDHRSMFLRYGGGGVYAGVIVVLIALWGMVQAFRKSSSVFTPTERKLIWFWSGIGFICVLVGFGRFAPFYQFFYALPFASTIRNPSKFFHVVEWILVILFAYGAQGLSRTYLEAAATATRGVVGQLQAWWPKAPDFDRGWVRGSAIALGASLAGWFMYAASRERLVAYLNEMGGLEGRGPEDAMAMAQAISSFSIRQVGWFVLLLGLGLGLLAAVLSGYFSGRRGRMGAILLGVVLALDLARANMPWVVTWNWVRKYASNPVIEMLAQKPYEQRVAVLPFGSPSIFSQLYDIEWKQQLFPYNNIQSLDIIMMPRAPVEYIGFESALFFDRTTNTLHRVTRRWQLTNTRYLLGPAQLAPGVETLAVLNQQIDPGKQRFRVHTRFDVGPKPEVPNPTGLDELTAVIKPDGQYAVFDFTGALPRAKLYTNWLVSTNDEATLSQLANPGFDPERTVLTADALPAPGSPGATNQNAGTVEFASYASRRIVLDAKAAAPSVLLLNDKYNPDWKVLVDGKAANLLRCNYLMRGVYLPAGSHAVEFRFEPLVSGLYISVAALVGGLMLLGYLVLDAKKRSAE